MEAVPTHEYLQVDLPEIRPRWRRSTLYAIDARRSHEVVTDVLSEAFEGVLIRDGLRTYEHRYLGDVRHSQADITKARERLGHAPTHTVEEGLQATLEWCAAHVG